MIITGNKIKAVSCILPISERTDLPQRFGLRHRAGIGVTEHSDALVIVTSEETGEISFCSKGDFISNLNPGELKIQLKKEIKE